MIILDTCVLLESIKPAPEPRVMSWIESLPEHRVYLAAITIGELEKGVRLLDPGTKAQALRIWLEQLLDRFQGRIGWEFTLGQPPLDNESKRSEMNSLWSVRGTDSRWFR